MKNRIKLLLITLCAMTLIAISAVAVNASTVGSGKCGDNITWTLSSDRVLTINGTGPMYNYKENDDEEAAWCDAPWYELSYERFDDVFDNYDEDEDDYDDEYDDLLGTLKKVIISEGVTSIGDYALAGLEIGSISLPSTIETIGAYAISYWCDKQIELPSNIKSIGERGLAAFDFENVFIPASLENIGPEAINCSSFSLDENNKEFSVKNGVLFSKDKKSLVRYPKYKKSTTYTVPNGTESIDIGAFCDCAYIKTLKIPEGVKSLGTGSIAGAWQLKKIYLPKSLTTIKKYAFTYYWGDVGYEPLTVYYAGTKSDKNKISVSKKYNERLYEEATWKYNKPIGKASIKLNKTKMSLTVGSSTTLNAILTNCSGTVKWESSKTSIATVSSKGKVTAKKNGTATITASIKYCGETYKKTCKVTVEKLNKNTDTSIKSIKVKINTHLPNVKNETYSFNVDWGFDMIMPGKSNQEIYNNKLAIAALPLAEAAYSENRVVSMLNNYGFGNVETVFYENNTVQYPAAALGYKKVKKNGKQYNLFAITVRGSSSKEDWMTNIESGIGADAFNQCANNVKSKLEKYVLDMTGGKSLNSPENIYLITGHSLGGATANILAAYMFDPNNYNVYCYTYATPLCIPVDSPISYKNIHNILSVEDIVTKIQIVNSSRYGGDYWWSADNGGKDFDNCFAAISGEENFVSYMNKGADKVRAHHALGTYLAYLKSIE